MQKGDKNLAFPGSAARGLQAGQRRRRFPRDVDRHGGGRSHGRSSDDINLGGGERNGVRSARRSLKLR
jgi:hypothetical protein